MEQKIIAKVLKIFSILSFFIGSLFMLWYIPVGIYEVGIYYPQFINLQTPAIVCCLFITGLCYIALFHFWKICCQIETGNSFTMENAKHMKIIGFIALSIFIFGIMTFIFLNIVGCISGPLVVMGFFVEFVLSGVTVICLALSALIKNAAIIKAENDLTI